MIDAINEALDRVHYKGSKSNEEEYNLKKYWEF